MLAKRSILLADDESSILETLRLAFEREGYEVATAKSSTEAVGLIKRNGRFDAVITDLNMEEEDIGLEVARVAMMAKPRPAVVVCTGFASMANSCRPGNGHRLSGTQAGRIAGPDFRLEPADFQAAPVGRRR